MPQPEHIPPYGELAGWDDVRAYADDLVRNEAFDEAEINFILAHFTVEQADEALDRLATLALRAQVVAHREAFRPYDQADEPEAETLHSDSPLTGMLREADELMFQVTRLAPERQRVARTLLKAGSFIISAWAGLKMAERGMADGPLVSEYPDEFLSETIRLGIGAAGWWAANRYFR